jgi:hypothetical protein
MKRTTELVYPAQDGQTELVTLRAGMPPTLATPRDQAEAVAIGKALLHSEGDAKVTTHELAAPPRLRRAWCTDQGRVLLKEENERLNVYCFRCDQGEARELLLALDDALATRLDGQPASAQRRAGERTVAA